MVSIFDFDASAMGRLDSTGLYGQLNERAYMAFSTPDISLVGTKTNIQKINSEDLFSNIPRWVINAYRSMYNIDYSRNLLVVH